MADPLYELLAPYFDNLPSLSPVPSIEDPVTAKYLGRLPTLPLASLATAEPQSLTQASHSALLSLQSLAARSYVPIIASAEHLSSLEQSLPLLAAEARTLQDGIPNLDEQAVAFSTKYSRSAENEVLDRRKRALMMARNVDRLSDILDLPTLLSSAISSSAGQGGSNTANYASALDLYSHIKRLHLLHQDSALVTTIYAQTEAAMREMTTSLIASLRAPNIKLAAAMRTIGWLRRVAPELDALPSSAQQSTFTGTAAGGNREGNALGALFLVCRLAVLESMLGALAPLRDLADQESATLHLQRSKDPAGTHSKPAASSSSSSITSSAWSGGQQTERYLKRYVEIFREQSFAIISMHKSIFPSSPDHHAAIGASSSSSDLGPKFRSLGLTTSSQLGADATPHRQQQQDPLSPSPSSLSTFALHVVGMLTATLKQYLPNVRDRSSRESLLTQVLYCAGSLGRQGCDFSLMLAVLDEDEDEEVDEEKEEEKERDWEWVEVMRKHRVLAGRLELLASGAGMSKGAAGERVTALTPPSIA
ncbi:hypothetical protein MMC29_001487 [Sticta canariensis]|nr:hypothetical protein [Sticta canariensis]